MIEEVRPPTSPPRKCGLPPTTMALITSKFAVHQQILTALHHDGPNRLGFCGAVQVLGPASGGQVDGAVDCVGFEARGTGAAAGGEVPAQVSLRPTAAIPMGNPYGHSLWAILLQL